MMEQMNAQMAALPPAVQVWLNWMMIVFLASVVFVWRHKEARYALGAFALTLPVAVGVFALWHNVHLFGIAHLLLWGPLLVYLVQRWRRSGDPKYATWGPYRVWVTLLMATIVTSLLFDLRDIYLVVEGTKAAH